MAVDAHKNFAYSTVATAPSPATSGTSLVVAAGDGALFPAASFNAVVWPAGSQPLSTNAEVVRVTNVSTDTFTITRTQEGTNARTIVVGDQIAAAITAKTLTDTETHSNLSGLTSGDDHTQYALLAGRSGGQTLEGDTASGGNLTLSSTHHATKGKILLGSSSYYFDQANSRLTMGSTTNTNAQHWIKDSSTDIYGLLMNRTGVDPVNNYAGISVTLQPTATTNNANSIYGLAFGAYTDTTNFTWANLYGFQGFAYNQSQNTATQVMGGKLGNRLLGSGSTTTGIGLQIASGISSGATGSMGTNIDIDLAAYFNSGSSNSVTAHISERFNAPSATITSALGIAMGKFTTGSTRNVQIQLGSSSATAAAAGNWSIYDSTTYQSALSGNLRVGSTTAPTVALDVTGAALISTTLGVTGHVTFEGVTSTGATGTGKLVFDTSPTIASPTISSPVLRGVDGWIDANETWTYASGATTNVGTFTIAGVDLTTKYQAGDRVKFTQTTVKYGIITKVAFSTDTTVTIYMGTDYTIANAAISANYYSKDKSPQGFPVDPAKWTITTSSSNDRTTASTTYATLTDTLVVPIGAWQLSLEAHLTITTSTTNFRVVFITLSSDASTETDTQLTASVSRASETSTSNRCGGTVRTEKEINVAASTTFTLMGKCSAASLTCSVLGSSASPTLIKAICAYL